MLEHGHSYAVLVVRCSCDEEPMQKFVDDAFDVRTNLELARGWQVEGATCLHR